MIFLRKDKYTSADAQRFEDMAKALWDGDWCCLSIIIIKVPQSIPESISKSEKRNDLYLKNIDIYIYIYVYKCIYTV